MNHKAAESTLTGTAQSSPRSWLGMLVIMAIMRRSAVALRACARIIRHARPDSHSPVEGARPETSGMKSERVDATAMAREYRKPCIRVQVPQYTRLI